MSSPTRYTGRQRRLSNEEIVALYAELKDSNAVGDRAGCSGPTVLGIVRAAGVQVPPPGGPTGRRVRLAIGDQQIVEMYRAGMTAREIAPRAGCSESMVYRILKDAKVAMRRHVPRPRPR